MNFLQIGRGEKENFRKTPGQEYIRRAKGKMNLEEPGTWNSMVKQRDKEKPRKMSGQVICQENSKTNGTGKTQD